MSMIFQVSSSVARHLSPARWLFGTSDRVDEVWEPFLRDGADA